MCIVLLRQMINSKQNVTNEDIKGFAYHLQFPVSVLDFKDKMDIHTLDHLRVQTALLGSCLHLPGGVFH